MLRIAQAPPNGYETLAPYLYILCMFILVLVDILGQISKGASRWLEADIAQIQPAEIAKIIIPLMVARFVNRNSCHSLNFLPKSHTDFIFAVLVEELRLIGILVRLAI